MDYNVTYERSIYKSYMKIQALESECLDEKILFMRQMDGLLPMEKSFLNGEGQYWYDISGKQALDQYCKANSIGIALFEQLILHICNQLECFEWNLLKEECLLLRPEMIFVGISDEKIYFTGYPGAEGNIFEEFRTFMDFLLTKIEHSNVDGVKKAYEIYEIILQEEFQIFDLKKRILDGRMQRQRDIQILEEEASVLSEQSLENGFEEAELESRKNFEWMVPESLKKWIQKIKRFLSERQVECITEDEVLQDVVYSEETDAVVIRSEAHPTICLAAVDSNPRGLFVYEGTERFSDFELTRELCIVGKSQRVDLKIDKNTISQYHAKIDWRDGNYYIEDMNSTNGTFVNEEILNYRESRLLCVGDVIRFADVKYRFW